MHFHKKCIIWPLHTATYAIIWMLPHYPTKAGLAFLPPVDDK